MHIICYIKEKNLCRTLTEYFLLKIFWLLQLQKHRNTFITMEDFNFLYKHGINAVRIPVGWWIAFDPDPPAPFIGGSLEALDNAFEWAQ